MNHEYESIERGSERFPLGIFAQNVYLDVPHHHIEYELFYLKDGRAVFGMEGFEHNLYPGDFILVDPGVNHYAKSVRKGEVYNYVAMVFDISLLGKPGDPCRTFFESIRVKRYLNIPNELAVKMITAAELEKNKVEGREIAIKAVLYDIISHIILTKQYEVVSLIDTRQGHGSSAIESALMYIRNHFRENIVLEDFLELTNYSKSHFIRLFKEHTGTNLVEYINKYRIERSCLDLIYTDKNITEIATENGFNNIQYFSRTFKKYMKCTPKQYQKNGKNLVVPSSMATD